MNYEHLRNILFIDIETISAYESLSGESDQKKILWNHKSAYLKKREEDDPTDEDFYFRKAGIFAEFGKIIAIGTGFLHLDGDQVNLRIKTISNENEKELLEEFLTILNKFNQHTLKFCAHNGKEFDYPYLCRRLLVNGFHLPHALQLMGKRSWEIQHLDTLELWKFGDYKHYTSLDLLASVFGIQSSKTDMKGSEVNEVYYREKNLKKISEYCSRDVIVTAKLYLRLTEQHQLSDENVIIIHE